MRYLILFGLMLCSQLTNAQSSKKINEAFIRINQYGYRPDEAKRAIVFSNSPVREKFHIIDEKDQNSKALLNPQKSRVDGWGRFKYYYYLDFSDVDQPGTYRITGSKSKSKSTSFKISERAYEGTTDDLLRFMQQQRCGYNPFLDMVCHKRDGRSHYGKMPDSTYIDVSGGWHDAGDQLKYLITGSYATAHMLKAYELYPKKFSDRVNALGQPWPNGIPDVLDEAKWGLDWILKLHVAPDQLIHQIADDRDHRGWKMPDEDGSDYGWGSNSYRVAYFANGQPQGLNEYKSKATGVANIAGRSAAALALGAMVWKDIDESFSLKCLNAAKTVYALGKSMEGYQQGNSYGAPYRYNEQTWADDMEWGAAELYRLTENQEYLSDAKKYAEAANTDNWLMLDSAAHYQYYPFINLGHFVLYDLVDPEFREKLAGYYRSEINNVAQRAKTNSFGVGVPFIWCSNNLITSFITEILLYEKMTGDTLFHQVMLDHRDWLFGKNPWGTSMFTGMPADGEYPLDVHTSVWAMTKKVVPGGLIDGPIFVTIYNKLLGLELAEPDEFAKFQNEFVTYHDDVGDYSTNEPTMDGTAGSLIMMAHWSPDAE
ncbi:MAG: glycoside hydrolase family 9 protein [Cytophagales bacterium]|nr:glycoside hydrolase family 9 protein [Cytophagales bacterium]